MPLNSRETLDVVAIWNNLCPIQMRKDRPDQPMLPFATKNGWGGRRDGAGRKAAQAYRRHGVPHRVRGEHQKRHPVHITVRLRRGLRGLRAKPTFAAVQQCFALGCDRFGFRLVHYSVQSSHLHMICEAEDRRALSRGIQGLLVRIAKALNKLWQRQGGVFDGRYHERVMQSPRQVRNTIAYVLNNLWRHLSGFRSHHAVDGRDPMASGSWFNGWADGPPVAASAVGPPVSTAESWLLRTGWRRIGLIRFDEVPRGRW